MITDKENGFSLIELLVGLAILAFLFYFSFSFAPSLYKKNQLEVVAEEVRNAINFARTQALSRSEVLVLTHFPDTKDWSKGMLLFVGKGNHRQYTSDATLLHEWRWQSKGMKMKWRGFQSMDYLLFSPEISSSAVNGYFLISNNSKKIKLVVNRLGRIILL